MHRFDSFGPVATPTIPATASTDDADYQTLLGRMGLRDRQAVERHVAACEAEPTPDHANLWRQLACLLASLASKPAPDTAAPADAAPRTGPASRQFGVQAAGQKAVQFFIADGKYRRQLFALEDLRDGVLVVYTVDALAAALRAGALRGPARRAAARASTV